jgi:hypothetical protein
MFQGTHRVNPETSFRGPKPSFNERRDFLHGHIVQVDLRPFQETPSISSILAIANLSHSRKELKEAAINPGDRVPGVLQVGFWHPF